MRMPRVGWMRALESHAPFTHYPYQLMRSCCHCLAGLLDLAVLGKVDIALPALHAAPQDRVTSQHIAI